MPHAEGESTAVSQQELVDGLYSLDEKVEGLQGAVDELREQVQCALQNVLKQKPWRTAVTSMPRDPCAEDFGARVNDVPAEQIDIIRRETIAKTRPAPESNSTDADAGMKDPVQPTSAVIERETGDAVALSPNGTQSSQTALDVATDRSPTKRQPLSLRIYFQPVMTEIVRAIGYETLPREEALLRLEPLAGRYGKAALADAASELVVAAEGSGDHWQLSDEARRLSRALLGPPPEPAQEAGAAQSAISREVAPKNDERAPAPGREVNVARKTVLTRFREHLIATDEDVGEVAADDLQRFREHGWMLPDLMIVDEFIAVRRKLSAAQRHDMQQWLEASEYGIQATRVWPRETPDGWEWIYEVVAEDPID